MNRSIHLSPDALARLVIQAATNAQEQGYWRGPGTAAHDAVEHLSRFLGLLAGGDDDLNPREISVLGEVFRAARGETPGDAELRASIAGSVALADDPDALQDFLLATPPYVEAIAAMDRERGTHNTHQVVTSLSGLALAMLSADGRAAPEEDSAFTTHLNHLRGVAQGLGGEARG
jgi:hypothetical protein